MARIESATTALVWRYLDLLNKGRPARTPASLCESLSVASLRFTVTTMPDDVRAGLKAFRKLTGKERLVIAGRVLANYPNLRG